MLVRVFLVGGAEAPSAPASEAWLSTPGSPDAPSESCADALGFIFRFLLDDGEVSGNARAK